MELMDTFAKYDNQIDSSCKRNEQVYFQTVQEIGQEPKLMIERQLRGGKKEVQSVEEYIRKFKWDTHKFPMDKSLKVIGAKIIAIQKTCDEKLKKQMEEQNSLKNKLNALAKKESNSLMHKDLGDVVYEKKISSQFFVNTHGSKILTTILVVVNKKNFDKFKEIYPTLLLNHHAQDYENWQKRTLANIQHKNQNIEIEEERSAAVQQEFEQEKQKHQKKKDLAGVIPNSDKYLGQEDADGNQLFRVTCMTEMANDYVRLLKKNGFQCQEFVYDGDQYVANKNLEAQLRQELRVCNDKLTTKSFHNFQELFQALVHLKVMRVFIDGVLRFGIPPVFLMGIIKPAKNCEEKIKARLTDAFSEEHLKEMYGQKEEA